MSINFHFTSYKQSSKILKVSYFVKVSFQIIDYWYKMIILADIFMKFSLSPKLFLQAFILNITIRAMFN